VVVSLFAQLGLKALVLNHLRQDRTLDDTLRQATMAAAEHFGEDPNHLNTLSWSVVSHPDAPASRYRQALLQAQQAHNLDPTNGPYLNTLGVAQYRLRHYSAALESLTRSEPPNAATFKGPHPSDLAFLAMTQYQLGHKDKAMASLARLREAMKLPRWAQNTEAVAFLREAEALIEGKK
jgi:Flp pilus assembly protein TadD